MPLEGGWLVVLAEKEAIRWVLDNGRMAFSEGLCSRAAAMDEGDPIVLSVARGAYHNPTRDQSHILGIARAASRTRRLRTPLELAGRSFSCVLDLSFDLILEERVGTPFKPLVSNLLFIRRPEVWGHYLRAGLVRITKRDVSTFERAIAKAARKTSSISQK
jgi:hypothetical protein